MNESRRMMMKPAFGYYFGDRQNKIQPFQFRIIQEEDTLFLIFLYILLFVVDMGYTGLFTSSDG